MSSSSEDISSKRKSNDFPRFSRRKVWIQKRWKKAVNAIKTGHFEDNSQENNKLENGDDNCDHEFASTSKCKPCVICSCLTNYNGKL